MSVPAPSDALTGPERALLVRSGLAEPLSVQALAGGANNRVFRVHHSKGTAILKRYFSSESDRRDRFAAEQAFYVHAYSAAPQWVPQTLGWDAEAKAAVFEEIAGRKLTEQEIGEAQVDAAAAFIAALNTGPRPALASASEACFSLAEHGETVRRRVGRLKGIVPETAEHREALALVEGGLLPRWREWETVLHKALTEAPPALSPGSAVVSPSDFGFHNALLTGDGTLRFIDFEYAGLDDPAKLVCDFFCQPEIPVSVIHRVRFREAVAAVLPLADRAVFVARAELLQPAYALKWCCIMLNEFLPDQAARRRFSLSQADLTERRRRQLVKVARALDPF